MRRRISVVAAVLTLIAAARASPAPGPEEDPLATFRATLHGIDVREAGWWKGEPDAEVEAHEAFHRPLREQYARHVHEPRPDFAPIRALYAEALAFEEERAAAFVHLADSGDPQALPALWQEARRATDLVAEAQHDNAAGRLEQVGYLLRQGPSIRIHALAFRGQALANALARVPGAAGFLGSDERWREAAAGDRAARSVGRRVFVVDALATLPAGAGRGRLAALLADESPEVRIAALEGLGGGAADLPLSAAPLLADAVPAVRFALLDVLRAHPPADAAWIEPLAQAYLAGRGRLRVDALRALQAAAGSRLPDDPEAWTAWLEATRAARQAGAFRRGEAPTDAGTTTATGPAAAAVFWGLPVESERVLIAADGWSTLVVPADHALQATRHVTDWLTGARGWLREHESIQGVLARLLPPFLEGLPPSATFRVLLLGSPTNRMGDVTWLGERGGLPPTARNRRRARTFVEDFHVGTTPSFHAGLEAVLGAEDTDTAVLVTSGYLRTDRFLMPEALVAELVRRNRFRRLRLHVVHVMDQGPECAWVLQQIAGATGGTLVRALQPPPR